MDDTHALYRPAGCTDAANSVWTRLAVFVAQATSCQVVSTARPCEAMLRLSAGKELFPRSAPLVAIMGTAGVILLMHVRSPNQVGSGAGKDPQPAPAPRGSGEDGIHWPSTRGARVGETHDTVVQGHHHVQTQYANPSELGLTPVSPPSRETDMSPVMPPKFLGQRGRGEEQVQAAQERRLRSAPLHSEGKSDVDLIPPASGTRQGEAEPTRSSDAGKFLSAKPVRAKPKRLPTFGMKELVELTALCMMGVFCLMMAPSDSNNRVPPSWGPDSETTYSFEHYSQDVLLWTMVTDLQPYQQCAALISRLRGGARELARHMQANEMLNGGIVNGVQVDSVTLLFHALQQRYAPMSEETRLVALTNIMTFHRRQGERINDLLTRFETTVIRAQTQAQWNMNTEGLSWMLLRTIGVNDQQLLQLLGPYGGNFPSTQQQYAHMQTALRRMGHILENQPGNVAQSLRRGSGNRQETHFAQAFMNFGNNDQPTGGTRSGDTGSWSYMAAGPRTGESEPWNWNNPLAPSQPASSSSRGPQPSWTAGDWQYSHLANSDFHAARNDGLASQWSAYDYLSDTDTDTDSDDYEEMDFSAERALPENQQGEAIYWGYQQGKKKWRRWAHKTTRKVRRFAKTKGGKGAGGKRASAFMATTEVQAYFKGKGKRTSRSSGKGLGGSRTNPKGPDGQIMKCSICGSENHFRAKCPQSNGSQGFLVHSHGEASSGETGPLAGLMGDISPEETFHFMMRQTEEPPSHSASARGSGSADPWTHQDPWAGAQLPVFAPPVEADPAVAWQNWQGPGPDGPAEPPVPADGNDTWESNTETTVQGEARLGETPAAPQPEAAPAPALRPVPPIAMGARVTAPLPSETGYNTNLRDLFDRAAAERARERTSIGGRMMDALALDPGLQNAQAAANVVPQFPVIQRPAARARRPAEADGIFGRGRQTQEQRDTARTNARVNLGRLLEINRSAESMAPVPNLSEMPQMVNPVREQPAVSASNDPTMMMATVQAFRQEVLGNRWNNRMNQSSMPNRIQIDMGANQSYMSNNSLFVAGNVPVGPAEMASALGGGLPPLNHWQYEDDIQTDPEMPDLIDSPRGTPPNIPVEPPTHYDGDEYTCSICTNGLEEGERVTRLRCRHCYHAECWQTAATQIDLCPNCRAPAEAVAVWNFIGPRPDTTQGQPNLLGSSPEIEHQIVTPRSVQTEHEFATPRDPVQPSFPTFCDGTLSEDTSNLRIGPSGSDGTRSGEVSRPANEGTQAGTRTFLNQTALANGKHALLVDVGSYGNLAGERWIRDAATIGRSHNKRPTMTARGKTLNVSGVGTGAQECTHDCTVPISMTTIDGRPVVGTYTAPTVNEKKVPGKPESSPIPGLLGLRALQERRAILDFSRGPGDLRITFPGPGDVKIELSPGSDTFQLHSAPSGHLMLPCCEHEAAQSRQPVEEEIALINRGPPPEPARAKVQPAPAGPPPEPVRAKAESSSSSSSSQVHLGMAASTGYASPSDPGNRNILFKAPPAYPPVKAPPPSLRVDGPQAIMHAIQEDPGEAGYDIYGDDLISDNSLGPTGSHQISVTSASGSRPDTDSDSSTDPRLEHH